MTEPPTGEPDGTEPEAIVNASPLIFLAKLDRTGVLPRPAATTPAVLAEVRSGGKQAHPEVETLDHLVRRGDLQVAEPSEEPPDLVRYHAGLDPGEASVLTLAVERATDHVVVDDRVAIRAAKLLGLDPASTPYLLLEACRDGRIAPHAFERSLDRLLDHGYHLSPSLYHDLAEAGRAGTSSDPD